MSENRRFECDSGDGTELVVTPAGIGRVWLRTNWPEAAEEGLIRLSRDDARALGDRGRRGAGNGGAAAMKPDLEAMMHEVATEMRAFARRGVFSGTTSALDRRYLLRCRRIHVETSTTIIFTRDVGYHTSGWWKNPDYERCWHLSLSAAPSSIILARPVFAELDRKTRDAWVKAFFGDELPKVWVEPPYSPDGKARDVWHWRLFADEVWQPLLPRGEVYSRELTEAGWLSASEVLALDESKREVEEVHGGR